MDDTVEPDLAIMLVGVARVVADRLGAAVERAGVPDMRTPFGYVIRALGERDRTLTEVAILLEVTKQAAIKVVDEMERRGFLERSPHPTDRRTKVLRLTDKGQDVRRAALGESGQLEAELLEALGPDDVRALRRALGHVLERHGDLPAAQAGRARALW